MSPESADKISTQSDHGLTSDCRFDENCVELSTKKFISIQHGLFLPCCDCRVFLYHIENENTHKANTHLVGLDKNKH